MWKERTQWDGLKSAWNILNKSKLPSWLLSPETRDQQMASTKYLPTQQLEHGMQVCVLSTDNHCRSRALSPQHITQAPELARSGRLSKRARADRTRAQLLTAARNAALSFLSQGSKPDFTYQILTSKQEWVSSIYYLDHNVTGGRKWENAVSVK